MANFDGAVVKTLAKEGGAKITNDPSDNGGLTKFGISSRSYPHLDIAGLTEDDAKAIYKQDYWDRVRGDNIVSQEVAESIFDTAVNMGVRTASRMAQLSAGVTVVDGIIGSRSVAKFNTIMHQTFLAIFTIAKIARYAHICNKNPSQRRFLLGWVNRALGG